MRVSTACGFKVCCKGTRRFGLHISGLRAFEAEASRASTVSGCGCLLSNLGGFVLLLTFLVFEGCKAFALALSGFRVMKVQDLKADKIVAVALPRVWGGSRALPKTET